jgi:hypothetical protein
MGRFVEDRFVAEFVLEMSIAEVWDQFQKENERELSWLSAFPRFPDSVTTGEVVEVNAPRSIRVRKHSEPCKGTEIAVSLEEVDNGTRILVVQSGFPARVKDSLESFEIGGNQIIADLILYLERGVEISRHGMPWAFPGFTTKEVGTGLQIETVMPNCFAERVGLRPGDLLMSLNGAPLFTQLCLQAMMRVFKQGESVEALWVRGADVQKGMADL